MKSLPVAAGERTFESYVNEFCGLTGLSVRTLRFQTEHRDVNSSLIISSSCLVKVTHALDFAQSDLSIALNKMVLDPVGFDITIKIGTKMIPSYSYVLSVRSPFLSKLFAEERKDSIFCIDGINPDIEDLAVAVFKWIHTGILEFSAAIYKIIEIAKIAKKWELA